MPPRDLLNLRMNDGSRHFAKVPWRPPDELKQRLSKVRGAVLITYIESPVETWINFEYSGFRFSVHSPLNDFWLFVDDPNCPNAVLHDVQRLLS